jgi:Nif-specific ferredoxin III
MTYVEAFTRNGTPWVPMYIEAIEQETCIGCGRCFKVCCHDVLAMKAISEDGELVDADDGEAERLIMTIAAPGNCIGCRSCGRVCSSKSMKFVAADTL